MKNADGNGDRCLDFDEWRNELKTRGYADCEIEAVFARYDLDGSRTLTQDELIRMQNELENEKDAINNEIKKTTGEDPSEGDMVRGGIPVADFLGLARRVDKMESSISSIVNKIDTVLARLEMMEKTKFKRREAMTKILDQISESEGQTEEQRREQMEQLVRQELDRWDSDLSDPSTGSQTLARPASGVRQRKEF